MMNWKNGISALLLSAAMAVSACGTGTEPAVRVQWAEEFPPDQLSSCHRLIADTSEPVSRLVFSSEKRLADFRVLSLSLADLDESGTLVFPLCTLRCLSPEHPLLVELTFYGDLPSYGISYLDSDGAERRFIVEISARDGSLLLLEF